MTILMHEQKEMTTRTMRKTAPPEWLLASWKEIDDKTFGKGFDCFTEDATCNSASRIGMDASKFARIHVPSSIPALPPCTILSNTGTVVR